MTEASRRTLKILEEMSKEKLPKKRRKYLMVCQAMEVYHYRILQRKLTAKAKELGAYHRVGRYVLLNMDILDEYYHFEDDSDEIPAKDLSLGMEEESLEDILSNINL